MLVVVRFGGGECWWDEVVNVSGTGRVDRNVCGGGGKGGSAVRWSEVRCNGGGEAVE